MGRRRARTRRGATRQAAADQSAKPATCAGITNYSSDAGQGSATFAQGQGATWRAALLGTVAAGALLFGYGRTARADCVGAVTTLTCTGDLVGTDVVNGGINVNGTNYDTLNVNTLTQNIAPASGVDGINFDGTTSVNITSNTGAFAINATGAVADGIYANGPDATTINHTGDVTSAHADGIYANSGGGATFITSNGVVDAYWAGIYARGHNDATVDHTGDVTSIDSIGVRASSKFGNSSVTSNGTIQSQGTAVSASALRTGSATINHTGDVTSTNSRGIEASSSQGVASVTSQGAVNAREYGISASGEAGASIIHTGDVTSKQDKAIYARSRKGEVDVTTNGNLVAAGAGIFAYAESDIAITVEGGAVTGGNGSYGVQIGRENYAGGTNTLTNYGTITSLSNQAIYGSVGDETVNNYGTVTGDVNLRTGANVFNNFSLTTFNSGAVINLGGGLLNNTGKLSPGGDGVIQTSALTGDIVQTPTGIFAVDANFSAGQADLVTVTGTADLAGTVVVNQLDLLQAEAGQQVTILSTASAGDLTDNGITVQDSMLTDFELLVQDNQDLLLTIVEINNRFATIAELKKNQASIGAHIDEIQAAGEAADFYPVVSALLLLPDLESIQAALDQLSPEAYLDTGIASLFSALDFSNGLFSCPVSSGASAFIREGQCVWAEAGGGRLEQDATAENFGFDEDSGQVSGGAQVAIGSDWFLGGAFGYGWGNLNVDTGVTNDLTRVSGGVALKYNPGQMVLAGAISGGASQYDTTRPISFPGFEATAASDHEISHGSGQFRVAYLVGGEWVYLKPLIDLNATYLDFQGFTETGAGGVNLTVASTTDWVYSVSPALELGGQIGNPDGLLFRPFVRGGITAFDDSTFQISSTFEGAPAAVAPFIVTTQTNDLYFDVAGGADIFVLGNASLRISYDGRFADGTEVHGGSVRGRWGF